MKKSEQKQANTINDNNCYICSIIKKYVKKTTKTAQTQRKFIQ